MAGDEPIDWKGQPEGWWRDPEKLLAAYDEFGSLQQVSEQLGGPTKETLCKWWNRLGLPKLLPGPKRQKGQPRLADDSALKENALDLLRKRGEKGYTLTELADDLDVAPRRARALAAELTAAGFRIEEGAHGRVMIEKLPSPTDAEVPAGYLLHEGERLEFGVVSDTHIGSKKSYLPNLHYAYDYLERVGVRDVLHPGDLTDGVGIYRHHLGELMLHTFDQQVEYTVENYPRRDGITTRIISGNHDLEGEYGRLGADPVMAVAQQRDDFDYLGRYSADLKVNDDLTVRMIHPGGGRSYALSYRPQKIVEEMESGTKPSVLLVGHLHASGSFNVRGVNVLLAGCLQGQTGLGRKMGSQPATGFWHVTAHVGDDGTVVRWLPEWIPIWPGRVVA